MANKEIQLTNADGDNLYPVIATRTIASNTDLDNCMDTGVWTCANSGIAATLINCPVTGSGFAMYVFPIATATRVQAIFVNDGLYVRHKSSTGWLLWSRFSNIYTSDTRTVYATWIATSSSSTSTLCTSNVSLSKGTWVMSGCTPTASTDMIFMLRTQSGTTDIGSNMYFKSSGSYVPLNAIFRVTAAPANVVIRPASVVSTTYTNTERGFLRFVKISNDY